MSTMKPIHLGSLAHLYRFTTTIAKNASLQHLIVTLNFIYCYYCRVFILFVLSVIIITVLPHPNVIKYIVEQCLYQITMGLSIWFLSVVSIFLAIFVLFFCWLVFVLSFLCQYCCETRVSVCMSIQLSNIRAQCALCSHRLVSPISTSQFLCLLCIIYKQSVFGLSSSPANKINAKPHFKDIMCELTYWVRWYMA